MIDRRTFIVGSGALSGCRRANPGFDGYAFIANEEGRSIAVVDLATFTVARHIRFGSSPTQILSHPSKPFLYALTPGSGTIYEIDFARMAVSRKIRVAPSLVGMRLHPQRNLIWSLSRQSPKLFGIDLSSLAVVSAVPLPIEADRFDLSASTQLVAAGAPGSGSIVLIDLETQQVSRPQKVSSATGNLHFRSDGKSLLVANLAEQRLTVLQIPGGGIVAHLPLSIRPDNLCFNQNGGQLFITGEGRDVVVVVFPYYIPRIAETVLAGNAPGAMAASTTHLFVANPKAGYVTILNIARRRVIATAAVGSDPGYIAITPNDQYALVLNRGSGDMAVIRTAAVVPGRTKSAALFTMIPVGSKPVSAAVMAV